MFGTCLEPKCLEPKCLKRWNKLPGKEKKEHTLEDCNPCNTVHGHISKLHKSAPLKTIELSALCTNATNTLIDITSPKAVKENETKGLNLILNFVKTVVEKEMKISFNKSISVTMSDIPTPQDRKKEINKNIVESRNKFAESITDGGIVFWLRENPTNSIIETECQVVLNLNNWRASGSSFSKCHYCISVLKNMEISKLEKTKGKMNLIQEEIIEHWNDIRDERLDYYQRWDASRQDPNDSLCIIFDAMDQCKTSFPILRRRVSKEIQSRSVPPIKTYLTGALVHRQDRRKMAGNLNVFDDDSISTWSNSNITAFKLSGRKLINEDFKEKLTSLLNENTYNELILKDASLCRNCYNLVNKTSVFLEKLSHSCDSFLKAPTSSKRCALSPITPKSVDTNPNAVVKNRTVKRSSRKQLKLFESPNETKPTCFPVNENSDPASFPVIIPVNENSYPAVTENSDHSYFKSKSNVKPGINHDLLEIIKESNTSSSSCTTLKEIKSQAATLTSRTTMLASVLFKCRDIADLADNADTLLADIVKEMHERYYNINSHKF
ncbi:unnamed protein product [Mytilus edulis]|uniref:Uncharacterized protein n=1 Tax=Mytilus edulis TaxID=6550 RepID=A0A8S3SR21_MYTED|nr:unnamed protein product [Mytilus edulis]